MSLSMSSSSRMPINGHFCPRSSELPRRPLSRLSVMQASEDGLLVSEWSAWKKTMPSPGIRHRQVKDPSSPLPVRCHSSLN